MATTQAVTRCAACGAHVRAADRFCRSCGAGVEPSGAPCSNCGEPVRLEAKFCRACGAAVGTAPAEPAPADPVPVAGPSPPVEAAATAVLQPIPQQPPRDPAQSSSAARIRRRPSNRRLIAAGAVAAALLVVTAGAYVLLGDDDGGGGSAPNAEPPEARAEPAPDPAAPAPVAPETAAPPGAAETPSDGDVRALLESYSDLFEAEDADGMGELFAADAVRSSDGETETRAQAIETYRRQFSQLTNPTYSLSDLQIGTEPGAATATGRYRIASDSGTVTGNIEFQMAQVDGDLLIQRLEVVAD